MASVCISLEKVGESVATDPHRALGVPRGARRSCPDGVDDAVAAACGIAGIAGWLPLAERAPTLTRIIAVLGNGAKAVVRL